MLLLFGETTGSLGCENGSRAAKTNINTDGVGDLGVWELGVWEPFRGRALGGPLGALLGCQNGLPGLYKRLRELKKCPWERLELQKLPLWAPKIASRGVFVAIWAEQTWYKNTGK